MLFIKAPKYFKIPPPNVDLNQHHFLTLLSIISYCSRFKNRTNKNGIIKKE